MDDDQPTTNGPGRCLGGRFVLLDRLGAGGGAVVVRARDRQLPRLVAVKLLCSRDADLRRRFVQESEVLASIDHPAIVRVLAHDMDGEDLYTVLELIERPDLHEHLALSGPLPWRQVLETRDPDRGRPGGRPPPGPHSPGREAGEHHAHRK
jgi:hypothetical protein